MNPLQLAGLVFASSCAIALGAGTHEAPSPQKFQDVENTRTRDEHTPDRQQPSGIPTIGMSLVAGRNAVDGGGLLLPPLPFVAPL